MSSESYIPASAIDTTFAHTTNLTSSALNSTILSCSNEYFAAASNLLTPTPPINRPGVFIHTGAWYDGWETRRHNPAPYDWVVIKLGVSSASIQGVEIDTGFFTGNYGEKASLQATYVEPGTVSDEVVAGEGYDGWVTVLSPVECGPAQRRAWKVEGEEKVKGPWTHVRLLMFPDGGFGRLRVYGNAIPPPKPVVGVEGGVEGEEELSSALVGAVALGASDQHYTPCSNLLLPGRGKDMGDGWETARSRTKGHVDWAIVKLGLEGEVSRVVVDTKDFRGNFPRAVRVHGLVKGSVGEGEVPGHDHPGWVEVVKGDQPCQADTEHVFEGEEVVAGARTFTHVKLTLVPDGGVKRFRIFGRRSVA
ncbi:allantoicase [Aspergillus ibericus CBS 121593]|uniref:allantoicase n=1 Tax=Aspergillus ibericus CBS 121593 TaxID=1448316 RepID=A0A395H3M1_9EURO|nr:allantoicase, expressed, purine use [Aspergillus ibericus CBS 121593]RAL01805.1 allantoicase, expressed, purine use [Aspergillus ibericus CBS 121593]